MSAVVNLRDFRRLGSRSARAVDLPPDVVRIDRPSRWGNPFPVDGAWIIWTAVALGYRADAPGRRDASIAIFRAWLTRTTVVIGPYFGTNVGTLEFTDGTVRTISEQVRGFAGLAATLYPPPAVPPRPDLEPLRGKRLACWCHPPEGFLGRLLCHGQVIAGKLDGVPPETVE